MAKKMERSGFAVTSLVLGICSFIPLVGILLGILAIVFGFISLSQIKKRKIGGKGFAIAGIILGIIGIVFTITLYGLLFYFLFNSESEVNPFTEGGNELTSTMLTQNKGLLELYKKETGRYPESLEELDKNYEIWPTDYFMQPFHYTVSEDGQSYVMKSSGPDKQLETEDDIY